MDNDPKKDLNQDESVNPPETDAAASEQDAEEIPLTPVAWLAQNAIYLIMIGGLFFWLYFKFGGFSGIYRGMMIAVGLGFVIFIHELGHFLVAKWCDVHVLTFSIGFGPTIPGCSFKRGETTYKLSLLPLGGYVNMVGEGLENDEEEDYPRSFKNKSVGQRMAIISAGVIMNIILGAVCFILIYSNRGMQRVPADVWAVDAGGAAWKQGVRDDWQVAEIGDVKNPHFRELKIGVMTAKEGQPIRFAFRKPGSPELIVKNLIPEKSEPLPVIGISAPPQKLEIMLAEEQQWAYFHSTAVRAGRRLDQLPDSAIVATTDPKDPTKMAPLPEQPAARLKELSSRMWQMAEKPFKVQIQGKAEPLELIPAPKALKDGDRILATTDALQQGSYNPFKMEPLPEDPRYPGRGELDPYEYRRRLVRLTGKVVAVTLERTKENNEKEQFSILVPVAYRTTLGLQMQMGKVVALREESPAVKAGLKVGDKISEVMITDKDGKELDKIEDIDPTRLPWDLAAKVYAHPGEKKIVLTVLRLNTTTHEETDKHTLKAVTWDESWRGQLEKPVRPDSPMSIPELGIAYMVQSKVENVKESSPAAKAGVKPNDLIEEIRFKTPGETPDAGTWQSWRSLKTETDSDTAAYNQWGYVYESLQRSILKDIMIKVRRPGVEDPLELTLVGDPDADRPYYDRGFPLHPDIYYQKADNLFHALGMGASETFQKIRELYVQLGLLVSGRVSTKNLGGPIEIAKQGFRFAGGSFYDFLFFIGFISVNLAVINFLPIPLLDGGHMVFLIYEKIRGKPAPERVVIAANYIGVAFLLTLMVFVFYNDIRRSVGW